MEIYFNLSEKYNFIGFFVVVVVPSYVSFTFFPSYYHVFFFQWVHLSVGCSSWQYHLKLTWHVVVLTAGSFSCPLKCLLL